MSEKTPVERAEDAAETHICDVHQWQEVGNLGLLAKEMLTAAVADREGLAEAIWEASRADDGTISAIGAQKVADAVARWLTGEATP